MFRHSLNEDRLSPSSRTLSGEVFSTESLTSVENAVETGFFQYVYEGILPMLEVRIWWLQT